jgi:tricarballylate dehydrogenase
LIGDARRRLTGMHAEPVDARAQNSRRGAGLSYGIVVDGTPLLHEAAASYETWWFARDIHFKAPGAIAFDPRRRLAGYRGLSASHPLEMPFPIARRARRAHRRRRNTLRHRRRYNAACRRSSDATRSDARGRRSLVPPKSNWARDPHAAFHSLPLVGAVAYTFGGLATDDRARVLRGGAPIPGLYAAGEITGHFYATAPNAVSVLRALSTGASPDAGGRNFRRMRRESEAGADPAGTRRCHH